MTKSRMAFLVAGTLLASQAAISVGQSPAYPPDPAQIRPYPSDGRLEYGYWYWRDSPNRAPMASESADNPAYNASADIPDNHPWFGDELLGQRPNPAQWRYFAQREAQLAKRPETGTVVCQDLRNRSYSC
jgi:hypothetical protein